ncbi:MAG: hypothetical protein GAK34_02795 [Delftia tsuruhatensis]|nr:MAG: hypothetical protein GAK34_02795 [Delftia tsuruhatensis]
MEIAQVVVVHVGAGIERTQRAVQAQGAGREALVDALAHLHLHEVARGDQLLGLLHGRQVVFLGKAALGRMALAGLDLRRADRVAQQILQLPQPLLGARIGLALAGVGIDDQVQLARQVVDHRHFLALQQQDVRAVERIGRAGIFQLLLDIAHGVVAEVAGQPAAKTRQPRAQRHLEALLVGSDEFQRIALGRLHHLAIGHHLGACRIAEAAGAQQRACRQADEAVAPEALAAHHGLQQKAVLAVTARMGQLEVEGQGGFEIRKRLDHQRDAVVALRSKALEFEFGDHGGRLRIAWRWQTWCGCGLRMDCADSFDWPVGPRVHAGSRPGCFSCSVGQACARARLPGLHNLQ